MPIASSGSRQDRTGDELCDRFQTALLNGEQPRLDDWLNDAGAPAALPKLALIELEFRLKKGAPATAREYFGRYPVILRNAESAMRLVAAEFRAARAVDPRMNETAFRLRYPQLADRPEWSNGPWIDHPRDIGTLVDGVAAHPASRSFPYNLFSPAAGCDEIGRLGDYRILGIIGEGGMGVVLRAEETKLGRTVALKLMKPEQSANATARERFDREARAAAAVEHPRVVIIYAVGEFNDAPYIAMPLMKGRSLAARLADDTPLPLRDAVRYAREMAEGLAAAHEKGLIHRDVKPDNVWLEDTSEGTHVRLLDFGLVRGSEGEIITQLTQPNAVIGTPAYMAPEQAAGQCVDARADIFSLGCVFYQMVTGTKPFTGPSIMAILHALANHHPPSPHTLESSVAPILSDLIGRMLSKSPQGRPTSAAQVVAELRKFELAAVAGNDATIDARIPSAAQSVPAPSRPRRLWPIGVGAIVAVAVLAAVLSVGRDRKPEQTGPRENNERESAAVQPVEFRVKTFDVKHLKAIAAKTYQESGVLGTDSFEPRLHDRVRVEAKLSRPGYAYLLAFRPDGQTELCLPLDENTPPALGETIIYHPEADTAYGLDEGTGLWVFSIVASEKSLPPYAEWKKKIDQRAAWSPSAAEPGTIWHDDGVAINVSTSTGNHGVNRGGGVKIDGPQSRVKSVTDALNRAGKDRDAKAVSVGFGVSAR